MEKIPLATPFCIAIAIDAKVPPAIGLIPNAPYTIDLNAPGNNSIFAIINTNADTMYTIAINGTTNSETLAILLIPPITTRPTHNVKTNAVITIAIEYSLPNIITVFELLGSKKDCTAVAIPLTCVNVPIPTNPTHAPKKANILANHFHFTPIPFSI